MIEWSAREYADLLASIVRSSEDAIISRALDGAVTSWNPAAETIYGYTPDEALGMPFLRLVPTHLHGRERQIIERIHRGERVERVRAERVRKDGTVINVTVTASPVVDPSGRVVGMASVSHDLTEQEVAEAKFRGLLESLPYALVGVRADGRIALVNAQAERLFGYSRAQLIGQPVEILVPVAARELHPAHRQRYFADPQPRPMGGGMQLAARRRDGTEFPAEISLSALDTEDGVIVSVAIWDVTERLEAAAERERLLAQAEREREESRLHQSQRLESLGQLAGGVAHDFNNLLAVILNYTSFVGEEISAAAGADPTRWQPVRDDVAQIQQATERAIGLTHQLLTFGRREVVRPRVLDLNEVVYEVQQLLGRTLGEQVKCATLLHPGLYRIKADPGQIEQILLNLAVNAQHAMPGGGTLTLETDNMSVREGYLPGRLDLPAGPYARLRISDTGVGMPKEVVARAFEPFFTTKPKGEGTGLGLATVYGIVTQAGGHVEIYSEPGIGTTITILLPATDEVPQVEQVVVREHRRGSGETILVVEDEDAMREVTRRILERNGYEVISTGRGAAAVDRAAHHPGEIELLLTDVIMPQMLGKEVAERVHALRPRTRVLYMSGYAQPVLTQRGTLVEGTVLVEKPFSEEQLLDAVRDVLDAAPES